MQTPVRVVTWMVDGPWCRIADSERRCFRVRLLNPDGTVNIAGQLLATLAKEYLQSQASVYIDGGPTKWGWRYLDNINPVQSLEGVA